MTPQHTKFSRPEFVHSWRTVSKIHCRSDFDILRSVRRHIFL